MPSVITYQQAWFFFCVCNWIACVCVFVQFLEVQPAAAEWSSIDWEYFECANRTVGEWEIQEKWMREASSHHHFTCGHPLPTYSFSLKIDRLGPKPNSLNHRLYHLDSLLSLWFSNLYNWISFAWCCVAGWNTSGLSSWSLNNEERSVFLNECNLYQTCKGFL